jgi:LysM repeat protein
MRNVNMSGIHWSYKTIFTYPRAWLLKYLLVTVVVVGFLIISGWNSSLSAQGESIHIVRPGENLTVIARRYGVSVNELARHNGIANLNLLHVGQSLRIPTQTSPPPSAPAQPYTPPTPMPDYRVERPNLRSSVDTTPTTTLTTTTRIIYTVRPNDTLYGIGRRFGVSVQAIKTRNGLQGDMIWVGQRLIIPSS